MADFPRGLVKDQTDEATYLETQQPELLEVKTSEFWEDILHLWFSRSEGFYVNSQQPPAGTSPQRCDLIVSNKDGKNRKVRLMVVEAKRRNKDTVTLKAAMEEQLLDYCNEYLSSKEAEELGVHYIYGLAAVGTRGRVFTFDHISTLQPLKHFKDQDGPEKDGYQDAKEDIWIETFRKIKSLPPSGEAVPF
jgi:hypothetical protein